MIEQTDSQNSDIQNKIHIERLIESPGWSLLSEVLEQKADTVRAKMNLSDDPSVVMSCVRHIDGIMFIKEVIQDFISRGDEALNQSA